MATKVKPKLTKMIRFRVSEFEYNKIVSLADKYAKGSISLWLIYACLNAPRKFLDFDEIKKSSRRKVEKKGDRSRP